MHHSIYCHIPFCRARCTYCDFNAYAGLEEIQADYTTALTREIEWVGRTWYGQPGHHKLPVHTIFFGGGTPSLTPLDQMQAIIAALRTHFDLTPNCEITLEANPGTVDEAYLSGLRHLGINRLSLGVQTIHPQHLQLFGRIHTFADAQQAVADARRAGFDNLNLDLIFGIPHQTLDQWQATLNAALDLQPEHLSIYALTLEFGTPLQAQVAAGQLPAPDDDLAADMYDLASQQLRHAGFTQYEISNWARTDPARDFRCRHNLQYWRTQPWLGLGAGAHGYIDDLRYSVVRSPRAYIQRMQPGSPPRRFPRSPAVVQVTPLNRQTLMGETMMMALRLTEEGIADSDFHARFGCHLLDAYPEQVATLQGRGLLEWADDPRRLRLTERGRLLGNQVFSAFI